MVDTSKDGKVSWIEFARAVVDSNSVTAIDDPRHWAYNIFNQIRRNLARENTSLMQFFGKQQNQYNPEAPVYVKSDEFMNRLEALGVTLRAGQERDLLELLDSQTQQGHVNLVDFQHLVGIDSNKLDEGVYDGGMKIFNSLKNNSKFVSGYTENNQVVKKVMRRMMF